MLTTVKSCVLALITTSLILAAFNQTLAASTQQDQPTWVAPSQPESVTAQDFRQQCENRLAALDSAIDNLEQAAPPFTVGSVLEPLNDIQTQLADGAGHAGLYEAVHPDATVREEASHCSAALADTSTRIALSRPLFDALQATDLTAADADTRHYRDLLERAFKLAGVDKDAATRKKIRALNDTITRLGQAFDKNILDDVRTVTVAPDQLDGLPDDYLAGRPSAEDGTIAITTRYVDTVPVYTFAHSDDLRRQLRQQDRSRGYPANTRVLKELLTARHELATLLGYSSYADLVTADKMVGSAASAQSFIDDFHALASPAAKRDTDRLLAQLQQLDADASQVERWQTSYLEELIRRQTYQLDAADIRQYFPYQQVREGIFALVENLFTVEIRPWQTDTWHPAVESWELLDNGVVVGRFHLDMHPRDGKYQHAAAFPTQVGIAGRQLPVTTLVCNFAGGDDPMAVMEFSEVRTFLHEFGHLLHALFGGQQRWTLHSGIATEWDFVEAPSQMLEEWLYDPATLKSFAINSKGEPLPDTTIEQLRQARYFGEGLTSHLQIYYAALALAYHRDNPADLDLLDRMLELEAHYSPLPHQSDTYLYANLGHLNGYSAIYYTYMWSKVIAKDLFSAFEQQGLNSRELAQRFRATVLAPGGSKPAAQLIEDFLGRPYNLEAFAKSLAKPQPAE